MLSRNLCSQVASALNPQALKHGTPGIWSEECGLTEGEAALEWNRRKNKPTDTSQSMWFSVSSLCFKDSAFWVSGSYPCGGHMDGCVQGFFYEVCAVLGILQGNENIQTL